MRRRGFTLIEMLIAVAVLALLATIAYPGYVGFKVRANRAAAQAFILDLASRQQLYFLDARSYAATLAQLGSVALPAEIGAYYSIPDPVVDNAAAPPSFMMSAQARSGTIQAADGDIGINSAGVRSGRW
ncbi:MAG: prepilin-type N-terminal cleavage/methylation domain-containing protein [Betaproteobacteria bacterium]